MNTLVLSSGERRRLLEIARQAITEAVNGRPLKPLDLAALPPALRQPGVTFVTLMLHGELRGCVGALEAYQPLAEDVREHAVAAALQDYRFAPMQPEELEGLEIEISRLTAPVEFQYECPEDLLAGLRPGVDGVIVRDGHRRATFLPQVWDKLPDPALFLNHLCQKMGGDAHVWLYKKLKVEIYQVEKIEEDRYLESAGGLAG